METKINVEVYTQMKGLKIKDGYNFLEGKVKNMPSSLPQPHTSTLPFVTIRCQICSDMFFLYQLYAAYHAVTSVVDLY